MKFNILNTLEVSLAWIISNLSTLTLIINRSVVRILGSMAAEPLFHKVHGGGPIGRFNINGCTRPKVMHHVRNMYYHLIVDVGKGRAVKGVIYILVSRCIDGNNGDVTNIDSFFHILVPPPSDLVILRREALQDKFRENIANYFILMYEYLGIHVF